MVIHRDNIAEHFNSKYNGISGVRIKIHTSVYLSSHLVVGINVQFRMVCSKGIQYSPNFENDQTKTHNVKY